MIIDDCNLTQGLTALATGGYSEIHQGNWQGRDVAVKHAYIGKQTHKVQV
jgi:hypothetical protein